MNPRLPLLLCLLLGACSTPPAAPEAPVEILPSGEAARREYWVSKGSEIQPDWNHDRLWSFLEGIRVRVRQPFSDYQGSVRRGEQATRYSRYVLDEDFVLFVTWKENAEGQRLVSAEVAGFWDLRDRVDPALFPALRQLHRARMTEGLWDYDPILLIRAVNAVLALGERASSALAAYEGLLRGLSFEEVLKYGIQPAKVLPVAWFVFDRPPLTMTSVAQLPEELPVPDPKVWPLYPFTLEQGLPFLVTSFSGEPLDFSKLALAARRSDPLRPALDPVEAVEQLTASPRWHALVTASDRFHPTPTRKQASQLKFLVRAQALQALAPVYTPPPDEPPQDCCKDPSEVRWNRIVKEVRALRLRWDPARQDFVPSR